MPQWFADAFLPISLLDALFYLATVIILIEALWDRFRSGEIPIPLLVAPFVVACAALIFFLELKLLFVILVIFLASRNPRSVSRSLSVLVCIGILAVLHWQIGLFLLIIWIFYEFNLLGSADALACFSLVVIRPDIALGFCLLVGMGAGAWIASRYRQGPYIVKRPAHPVRSLSEESVSSPQRVEEAQPLLWTIFLGAFLYILVVAFVFPGGWPTI